MIRRLWLRIRWGRECVACHVPPWLNPPRDHAEWLGHRWQRRGPSPWPEGSA